jgi:hypothetical protein
MPQPQTGGMKKASSLTRMPSNRRLNTKFASTSFKAHHRKLSPILSAGVLTASTPVSPKASMTSRPEINL